MRNSRLIIVFIFLIAGCTNKYQKFINHYNFISKNGEPDYYDLNYWAAHPLKKNPSDSIPKPLRESYKKDTTVDVFFIYPTTYTDIEKKGGWNAPIDSALLNSKTDYTSILYQASVFKQEEFLRPDTDKQIIGVIFLHQKKTVF